MVVYSLMRLPSAFAVYSAPEMTCIDQSLTMSAPMQAAMTATKPKKRRRVGPWLSPPGPPWASVLMASSDALRVSMGIRVGLRRPERMTITMMAMATTMRRTLIAAKIAAVMHSSPYLRRDFMWGIARLFPSRCSPRRVGMPALSSAITRPMVTRAMTANTAVYRAEGSE